MYVIMVHSFYYRAVGAGPAGPAAAGPMFGQPTRAEMPYKFRRAFCPILAVLGTSAWR